MARSPGVGRVGEVDHQPRRVGEGEDPEADPPARPETEGDVAFEIAGEAHLGQRGKARRHPFRLGKRRVAVLIVGRDPCEGDAEEGPAEERQLIAPTLRADRSVLDPCAREGVVELEDHVSEPHEHKRVFNRCHDQLRDSLDYPGHGDRMHLSADGMHEELQLLLARRAARKSFSAP